MDVTKYIKNAHVARLLAEANQRAMERDLASRALEKAEQAYSEAHRAVLHACQDLEARKASRKASDARADQIREKWGR